jgi:hypothetical protein
MRAQDPMKYFSTLASMTTANAHMIGAQAEMKKAATAAETAATLNPAQRELYISEARKNNILSPAQAAMLSAQARLDQQRAAIGDQITALQNDNSPEAQQQIAALTQKRAALDGSLLSGKVIPGMDNNGMPTLYVTDLNGMPKSYIDNTSGQILPIGTNLQAVAKSNPAFGKYGAIQAASDANHNFGWTASFNGYTARNPDGSIKMFQNDKDATDFGMQNIPGFPGGKIAKDGKPPAGNGGVVAAPINQQQPQGAPTQPTAMPAQGAPAAPAPTDSQGNSPDTTYTRSMGRGGYKYSGAGRGVRHTMAEWRAIDGLADAQPPSALPRTYAPGGNSAH